MHMMFFTERAYHAVPEDEVFKRRSFFKISIADLTGHIDVNRTMLLMSRLADECIRAAFGAALRLAGESARQAGDFLLETPHTEEVTEHVP